MGSRCLAPFSLQNDLLGRSCLPGRNPLAPGHPCCSRQAAARRCPGQHTSIHATTGAAHSRALPVSQCCHCICGCPHSHQYDAMRIVRRSLTDQNPVTKQGGLAPPVSGQSKPSHTQQQAHHLQHHVQNEQQAAPIAAATAAATAATAAEAAAPAHKGLFHGWSWYRVKRRLQRALRSPYDHAIWSLAAPAVLALAADPLLGMVDTAFVGRLGQEHLGALGVNTSLFAFAFVVFNFLTTATTSMIAAAVASNDTRQAGEVTWQAGMMALALGSGVTVLLLANADAALLLMGLDDGQPQLLALAKEYLVVRAAAAPAALLVTVGQGVFRGVQNMRIPLMVTVGTNVVHLALGPLFIFGLGWGLKGAALSTAAAEWLAAFWYLRLVWQERGQLALWPPPQFDIASAKERYLPFLQAGGAVLLRTGVLLGTKTMATAVATRLGASSVASHQVLMQIWILASMVVDSLAVAGQTLVAVALGRNSRYEARRLSQRLLELGSGLGIALVVLLGATSPWWPGLFTDDAEVLGHIQSLVPLAIAPLPINALVYTLDGVLVGASDFGYMMFAMVGASAIAASMLALVLPMGWGLEGVWCSLALLMSARLATLVARFQSEQGPLPPSSLALPSSASEDASNMPISSSGDAVAVAACDSAESSCEVDEAGWVVESALHEAEVTMHQHNLGIVPSGHEEAAFLSHVPLHAGNTRQQEQQRSYEQQQRVQQLSPEPLWNGSSNISSGVASNAVPVRLSRGSMRRIAHQGRPQHRKVHNGFEGDVLQPLEHRVTALTSLDEHH